MSETGRLIESGVEFKGRNKGALTRLFVGWIEAVTKYSRAMRDDDAGYYYGERANVSLLAAGAWLVDGIALEEYASEKAREGGSGAGRADLFASINGTLFGIEAKHKWTRAEWSDEVLQRRIKSGVDGAVSDALCLGDELCRYGCVFIVPRFATKPRSREAWQSSIGFEIDRIVRLSGTGVDGWAWCFPVHSRKMEHGGAYYPGVLVALKAAD
ncbi:hypothetical protein K32_19660 [Kaistia sp. 32K]|uniref:hypothetical protein n=1 Tax=Kaistia sp. 32K TaxID=2795690 RepID=UPI001916B2CB|nr:hypothetical protein [Kaistia sp. 32K]BCP53349.1 hypothetical protein K32_19660 [Kaistia sp. 32K]